MQTLVNGAMQFDEPGLMVSFEESPQALRENFAGMSWPFAEALDGKLHLVDGRVPADAVGAGSYDLGGLIAVMSAVAAKHGAKRIAIDGIDALFALSDSVSQRRQEFLRLLGWLNESGLTALLTIKEIEGEGGMPGYFGLAEYASDGAIALKTKMVGELSRRTLSVIKMRGSGFEAGEHPYLITKHGIRVLYSAMRTRAHPEKLQHHLSTGIERLDRMLAGGYRVGTSTLISGLPGTAKTTLGAAFLAAGCAAGERCLFIGFDEPAEQMVVDVRSVGIDLDAGIASGLLRLESFSGGAAIGDDHFLHIEGLIDEHDPKRVVIDPISALDKAGGQGIAEIVTERLVVMLKSRGISSLLTAVSDTQSGELESTPLRISTVADTWINLSFANRGGERNRTITIVKARGTGHSNQLREVVLSRDGIDLADVYAFGSEVLLGTARVQREQQALLERAAEADGLTRQLEELDREGAEFGRRLREVEIGLEQIAAKRSVLLEHARESGGERAREAALIHSLRHGDPGS
jgi:circadian clock protein KaiC